MKNGHHQRCIGALLGCACGDILGASLEGLPPDAISRRHGRVRDFLPTNRGLGHYTDDTQMTLALALSLVALGDLDGEAVSRSYAKLYESWRGYGGAAHRVMAALKKGANYRETGTAIFPEGSFGNGGAMRIAPVGLAFRLADQARLRAAVSAALRCTHVHPDAIDGAVVQARAVGFLSQTDPARFRPEELLRELIQLSTQKEMAWRLNRLARGLEEGASDFSVIGEVGNGIHTAEAVSAALWAFLSDPANPEECVIRAVGFGGDTDTIGAMTGALAGALHGDDWLPRRWYDAIENETYGRDFIKATAIKLAELNLN